jgi:hypothetical protein
MSGAIMLSATLPPITSNLIITGPITIDGNNSVRLMQVNSGATLTLQNLALQNGSAVGNTAGSTGQGGAILNSGTLSIDRCTLSSNKAIGGVGPGEMINVGGLGFGGAILNQGALTITNSTFSSNQATGGSAVGVGSGGGAAGGGAISHASGSLTVTNTTFFSNLAMGGSASSAGSAAGGAILNNALATHLTNVTFAGNQVIAGSGAGAIANGGAFFVDGGSLVLKGTILATSTGNNCASTGYFDAGYNLSDDSSCAFTQMTSQINVNNIGLASGLANNGGPTETIALEGNGLANAFIPIANCTDQSPTPQPLTTDQRGFSRPGAGHGNACSAGAYEYYDPFFLGELSNGNLLYNLTFPNARFFGYYSYQFYPWLYHYDLGFEYVVDANDGAAGVFFYVTSLGSYLYTNPNDFPVLWDYKLAHWLYYVAGTSRQFYDFTTARFFNSPPG